MSEELSYSPENEVTPNTPESQFGNKVKIEHLLETGVAHILSLIDELYPETPAHNNLVQIARLLDRSVEFAGNRSAHKSVLIEGEKGETLLGVFKPFSGESAETKIDANINSFYSRERAGYLISEHFGLDLVPPTVIRTIEGEVGSLQLFLLPENHTVVSDETITENHWEAILDSYSYLKMAVFDAIVANVDRNDNNMIVKTSEANAEGKQLELDENRDPTISAIDQGLILDTECYQKKNVRGPLLRLTYDNETNRPRLTALPEKLKAILEKGLVNRTELNITDLPDIAQSEVDLMWQRVEQMVETGKVISKYNQSSIDSSPTSVARTTFS